MFPSDGGWGICACKRNVCVCVQRKRVHILTGKMCTFFRLDTTTQMCVSAGGTVYHKCVCVLGKCVGHCNCVWDRCVCWITAGEVSTGREKFMSVRLHVNVHTFCAYVQGEICVSTQGRCVCVCIRGTSVNTGTSENAVQRTTKGGEGTHKCEPYRQMCVQWKCVCLSLCIGNLCAGAAMGKACMFEPCRRKGGGGISRAR